MIHFTHPNLLVLLMLLGLLLRWQFASDGSGRMVNNRFSAQMCRLHMNKAIRSDLLLLDLDMLATVYRCDRLVHNRWL